MSISAISVAIARQEGFNPLAIELAIGSYETSAAHKLLLFGLAIIAAALVAFLFPIDRFFKPQTRDLGTMTIGAPISEDSQALFLEFNKPWMKVLLEMDLVLQGFCSLGYYFLKGSAVFAQFFFSL